MRRVLKMVGRLPFVEYGVSAGNPGCYVIRPFLSAFSALTGGGGAYDRLRKTHDGGNLATRLYLWSGFCFVGREARLRGARLSRSSRSGVDPGFQMTQ